MKLTEAQLPFRDKPMNILSISSWFSMILGVLMLVVVFALVRPVWDAITARVAPLAGHPPLGWLGAGRERIEVGEDPATPAVRMLQ